MLSGKSNLGYDHFNLLVGIETFDDVFGGPVIFVTILPPSWLLRLFRIRVRNHNNLDSRFHSAFFSFEDVVHHLVQVAHSFINLIIF